MNEHDERIQHRAKKNLPQYTVTGGLKGESIMSARNARSGDTDMRKTLLSFKGAMRIGERGGRT